MNTHTDWTEELTTVDLFADASFEGLQALEASEAIVGLSNGAAWCLANVEG